MSVEDASALRRRWTDRDAAAVCRRMSRRWGRLPDPFGEYEGRVDWRGLRAVGGVLATRGLSGIDLAHAVTKQIHLDRARVEDCRFDGVKTVWVEHGSKVLTSSFRKASFQETSLGCGGSRYVSCAFTGAEFVDATATGGTFENCRFDDVVMSTAQFFGTSFVDCEFGGLIHGVGFTRDYVFPGDNRRCRPQSPGPRFVRTSFVGASLPYTAFSGGIDLSSVTFGPEVVPIAAHDIQEMAGSLDPTESDANAWITTLAQDAAEGQQVLVSDMAWFRREFGPDAEHLAREMEQRALPRDHS